MSVSGITLFCVNFDSEVRQVGILTWLVWFPGVLTGQWTVQCLIMLSQDVLSSHVMCRFMWIDLVLKNKHTTSEVHSKHSLFKMLCWSWWAFCFSCCVRLNLHLLAGWWCVHLFSMNCELLATCSALGYLEGDTYHKEADCLGEWFLKCHTCFVIILKNDFPAPSEGRGIYWCYGLRTEKTFVPVLL